MVQEEVKEVYGARSVEFYEPENGDWILPQLIHLF